LVLLKAGAFVVGDTMLHSNELSVRLHAATLAFAFRETVWPGATVPVASMAAAGRRACDTEPLALSKPAPQV
jgi:hypothetical protein